MPQTTERRTEKLDFRIEPSVKLFLQEAASFSHRSLTDFVLESALAKAEEALANRRTFSLDPEKWTLFIDALDAPIRPMPGMAALLRDPGAFNLDKK